MSKTKTAPLTTQAVVIRSTIQPGKLSLRGLSGESMRDVIEKAGFAAGDVIEVRLVRRGK